MPWYFVHVIHGGGHQSNTYKWIWRRKPVPIKTSEDIETFVEGEFNDHYFGGDSAIFRVKRVSRLPAAIVQRKMAWAEQTIRAAQAMIATLQATKTYDRRCETTTSRYPKDEKLKHLHGRCVRTACHKGNCDATKPVNVERFGD